MNDVECHKMHFCVYISLCCCIQIHTLLSRELHIMLACWLLPFVVFTLRLLKISLNLKITTFKALSLCNLNISQKLWLAYCVFVDSRYHHL